MTLGAVSLPRRWHSTRGYRPGELTVCRGMRPTSDIVSYRTLRRVVGLLGVSLPVVLAVWGFALFGGIQLEPSISDYYVLRTRDAFVGVLFTIAWFLFTYRGYDARDDRAGNLACVFALGVALFPNSGSRGERIVHIVSATALFLVLGYFSFFLFTLSAGSPTPQKIVRNRIYRACGIAIVVCIALAAADSLFSSAGPLRAISPMFWLESGALWAFGVSWFVKGETLFKDR
jgi:hypothetical protein